MQQKEFKTDSKWYSVAFFSKFLSSVECKYEIHNKEILAIIQTLKEWQHFLKDTSNLMKIWTDCKNLK